MPVVDFATCRQTGHVTSATSGSVVVSCARARVDFESRPRAWKGTSPSRRRGCARPRTSLSKGVIIISLLNIKSAGLMLFFVGL